MLALDDAALRGCGLSGQKMAYIRDLAQRFQCGQFCTERIVGARADCMHAGLLRMHASFGEPSRMLPMRCDVAHSVAACNWNNAHDACCVRSHARRGPVRGACRRQGHRCAVHSRHPQLSLYGTSLSIVLDASSCMGNQQSDSCMLAGRWSVDMFAMFQCGRPDILPVGDLGVRKGFQTLYKLKVQVPPGIGWHALIRGFQPGHAPWAWKTLGQHRKTPACDAGPAERGADGGDCREVAAVPQPGQLLHVARGGGSAQDPEKEQEHACWGDRVRTIHCATFCAAVALL